MNTKIKEPGVRGAPCKQAVIGAGPGQVLVKTCTSKPEKPRARNLDLSKKVFVFLSITWMNYVMFPYAVLLFFSMM